MGIIANESHFDDNIKNPYCPIYTTSIEYLKRDYIIEGLTNCCVEYDENGEEIIIIEKTK